MRHIPNFITSLNLAAGFVALIFAANGELVTASWLIIAAMVFDFLDGLSARLLKAYSDIGKELDSLADVVSFGVAPAFIIYQLLRESVSVVAPALMSSSSTLMAVLLLSPVIMPVCAAIRLAVFNNDPGQATTFRGVPTPANALAVVSFVIAGHYTNIAIIDSFTRSATSLTVLTIVLSLLMVSRIPLLSLKIQHLRFKGNEGRYLLVVLIITGVILFGMGVAPLIIPFYITASLLSLLFK
jgi:CDP-diacylglycerol--serine O-phosphatidyltransferase